VVRPAPNGPVARYFYDCEFIEDGRTIELISIGVVAEDGREYYAVSTEFDPDRANAWVRRHVLGKLPGPADPAWRNRASIRDELHAFFAAPGLPIELWAWYSAYDHVTLAQLWGTMPDLPSDVPRLTREIRQHWEAAGSPPIPAPGTDRHDALADARLAYQRWRIAQDVLA
jgi:3' exoribonuclease, RNase T-like